MADARRGATRLAHGRRPSPRSITSVSVPRICRLALAGGLLLVPALSACGPRAEDLHLASTTSTYDSGLLDELIPAFAAAYPQYSVKVIAVGTGEALELGRRGDVDVLLTHAPAAELDFVDDGFGLDRTPVMYNDFVILGPDTDPAGVREAGSAADALRRIAAARANFMSRGDDSGTHKRERILWALAGTDPAGGWYREAGQGMGATLFVADAAGAYVLADRGTYMSLAHRLELVPLVEADPMLLNIYSVIPVTGARHPEAARHFATWLTSEAGRRAIRRFMRDDQPRALFLPITDSDPPPSVLEELERALDGGAGS